ncbi:MAG: hypothetical protein D6762_07780 [Candidatus Neomarinimicrobiota bacterium]|nr:MAG: hypothetical protein D6762_07780 [Candidatus Neomarinimicrobiota bacterium]
MTIPDGLTTGWGTTSWLVFGFGNILLGKLVLLWLGYRRQGQLSSLILILLFSTLGGALAAWFVPSIMSVVVGATLFLYAAKWFLRYPYPLADLLAIFLALALGIGRLGCLVNGCCFGSPTDLPWGLHYAPGSPAHWLHAATGRIDPAAPLSLPVHPVQLYETLFMALALVVLLRLPPEKRRTPGPLLGFIGAYFLFRFGIEFIRDMTNVWWSELRWGPFSAFQGVLLLAGTGFLWLGHRLARRPVPASGPYVASPARQWILALITGVTVVAGHRLFQPVHTLQLLLFGSGWVVSAIRERRRERSWQTACTGLYGVIFAGLVTTLTVNQIQARGTTGAPPRLTRPQNWIYVLNPADQKLVRLGNQDLSFRELVRKRRLLHLAPELPDSTLYGQLEPLRTRPGIRYYGSAAAGRYTYQVSGCGGAVTTYSHTFGGIGGGVEQETRHPKNVSYLGVRGGVLADRWQKSSSGEKAESFSGSYPYLHSYANFDYRWWGAGIGFSLFQTADEYDGRRRSFGIPNGYLRLGPPVFQVEGGFNDRYLPVPFPLGGHLGLVHISDTGRCVRLGFLTFPNHVYGAFFADLTPPPSSRLRLRPLLMFGSGPSLGINLTVDFPPSP